MIGRGNKIWWHRRTSGLIMAVVLALVVLSHATAPGPSQQAVIGESLIVRPTASPVSRAPVPAVATLRPSPVPRVVPSQTPVVAVLTLPTGAGSDVFVDLRDDTPTPSDLPIPITAGDAMAQLQVLQDEDASQSDPALQSPFAPVPNTSSAVTPPTLVPSQPAQSHTAPVVRSLAPLEVGPDLPGMPEYVVVGRTYAVDCTIPRRDIPTVRLRFVDYLRNVLPNEWVASWPAAALDAGAIAAKQYAWHTTVIERKWRSKGYPFDLVDSTCDQVYRDGRADRRTDAAIQRTWDTVLLRKGALVNTFYRRNDASCGTRVDCIGQVETAVLAGKGLSGQQILARYFGSPKTGVGTTGAQLPASLPPLPAATRRPSTAGPPEPSATRPAQHAGEASPTLTPAVAAATPITHQPTPTATPVPTATPIPPTATPVPLLPNLVGLGEDQARKVLNQLGIRAIFADYQGRDRLGDLYDTVAPYTVVSTKPGAGTPIRHDMMVTLGIRAP